MNRTSVEDRRHDNDPRHWLAVLGVLGAILASLLVLGGCSTGVDEPAVAESTLGSTRPTPDVPPTPDAPPTTVRVSTTTVATEPVTTSTSGEAPPVTFAPMFIGLVAAIDDDLADRMSRSWRDGCPVGLDDLRYLTLSHWNFDGLPVEGEVVVHASVAADVVNAFQKMFAAEFPIQEMRLVADYGADDNLSMAANNTSAFNCRFVAGTQSWSKHAFGLAIDINPLVNPYVQGSKIDPPGGVAFADRSIDFVGSINAGDAVVAAFADIDWLWGGAWTWPDYQHFSAP